MNVIPVLEAIGVLQRAVVAISEEGAPIVSHGGAWKELRLLSLSDGKPTTPIAIRSAEEWRTFFVDRLIGYGRGAGVTDAAFSILID